MNTHACDEAAIQLRDRCLADPVNPDLDALECLLDAAVQPDRDQAVHAARVLIRVVVEELSDRFDPALAACYVEIFSRAIARAVPSFSDQFLRRRYADLCASPARPIRAGLSPANIIVLSRITLGADIAITSVFLNALAKRFPKATLWFAGPAKNYQLFAGLKRVRHWPLEYPRGGTLAERFSVTGALDGAFDSNDTLLADPDSRISQLGLLPVAPLTSTSFFESRGFASDSDACLSALASGWCEMHLGVENAVPRIAPVASDTHKIPPQTAGQNKRPICVSLGVGNNETKRLSAAFETNLLQLLAGKGRPVWIDAGVGGAEAEAVRDAIAGAAGLHGRCTVLSGSFAAFASAIAQAALYVGYDSAGQHAAAALGIPSVTIFKGFPNEKMFHRWQPRGGDSAHVVRVSPGSEEEHVLSEVSLAVQHFT